MRAFLFAAGRGERLRPLTETTPKPLVPVRGKPLIDWHLEKLHAVGIDDVIINVSYLREKIMAHVGDGSHYRMRVQYSVEETPLESGGGLGTAAALLGQGAVAVISADIFSDLDYQELAQRGAALTPGGAHFWLVSPRANAPGREFSLSEGRVIAADAYALTLANIGLLHSDLIHQLEGGRRYKVLPFYQRWVQEGRVTGGVHTGVWENITTIADVERMR